jgi:hypothetical protein
MMLMPNMLLPASIKLRCVCSDLPDLLAQIARRLQLPADIRVSHPVAKGEQPSPIVEFGAIPDKVRLMVWPVDWEERMLREETEEIRQQVRQNG